MFRLILSATFALVTVVSPAFGAARHKEPKDPNCLKVYQACTGAGFVQGEAKQGKGLWMDCIAPIMQGTTAKKSVIPLPTVDSAAVQACKAKHPKFGAGKVG